jgi:hypothetical protein
MAPVFGLSNLARRLVESVVGLFAILGFVYVPLGRHTGFEHAKAVFSTPAATSAIDDLTTSALTLRQRVWGFVTERFATGAVSDSAQPSIPGSPQASARRREPRPVPPKLK